MQGFDFAPHIVYGRLQLEVVTVVVLGPLLEQARNRNKAWYSFSLFIF